MTGTEMAAAALARGAAPEENDRRKDITGEGVRQPPRVLVKTPGLSRDEWLGWRRHGLGSSDAAAVAGLNPWQGPLTVYLDKLGLAPERPDTPATRLGRMLETVVADLWAEDHSATIRRRLAILQHPVHDWMLANLDREVRTPDGWIPLEIKTTGAHNAHAWRDGVPEPVQVQVIHQLAVTGAPYAYIACLIGGRDTAYCRLDRDAGAIRALMTIEERFWTEHVVAQQPPPMDVARPREAEALLAALYPVSDAHAVDLPADAHDWLRERAILSERKKLSEARIDEIDLQIRTRMETAELARLDGRPAVKWKTSPVRRIDQTALKAAHPDVVAAFTRETTQRRFTVVWKEEG